MPSLNHPTESLVDLYSDTKSRPSRGMREAMANAVVGDEQHFEDPTVTALVGRCASLLGHEDAIFLPSGTMANEIAVLVHCQPGDEIIAHATSHLLNFEGGAPAALAGVMTRSVDGALGMFDADTLSAAIRPQARHLPVSRLVSIEQTTNLGGGAVWPLDTLADISVVARDAGMAVHVDGARLMNAAVASGTSPAAYGALCDTLYLDFTKGLGAPFGAVLAGSRETIQHAWRWKQRLGGSMRQAGIMAAACVYALDHNVERLADDHRNAAMLASELAGIGGIKIEPVHTNMVYLDVSATGMSASAFNDALTPFSIRMSVQGPARLRAVLHLDVDIVAIEKVKVAVASVVSRR